MDNLGISWCMFDEERPFFISAIKEYLPEFGKIVEWGSGGSTILIASLKPITATFISLEQDKVWYDRVTPLVTEYPLTSYLHCPAKGNFDKTCCKRAPTDALYLNNYINTPIKIDDTDLFLDDLSRETLEIFSFQDESR